MQRVIRITSQTTLINEMPLRKPSHVKNHWWKQSLFCDAFSLETFGLQTFDIEAFYIKTFDIQAFDSFDVCEEFDAYRPNR
jgi:hypothetical protein